MSGSGSARSCLDSELPGLVDFCIHCARPCVATQRYCQTFQIFGAGDTGGEPTDRVDVVRREVAAPSHRDVAGGEDGGEVRMKSIQVLFGSPFRGPSSKIFNVMGSDWIN